MLAVLILLGLPEFALADTASFLVSPAHKELHVVPGDVATFSISITNQSDVARVFVIGAEDIETDANGEVVLLSGDSNGYSLASYLKAPSRSMEIAPRETISVPITVELPSDVLMPGLYGAVTISVAGGTGSEGQGAGAVLSSRIAVPVLVRTNQDAVSSGDILSFKVASGERILSSGPVALLATYANSGDVHSRLSGRLILKNSFGLVSDEKVIDSWFILPGATRSRVDTIGSSLLIGRYSATLSLVDAGGGVEEAASVSFWVIPWKLLLVVLVAILVIVRIVRTIRRK